MKKALVCFLALILALPLFAAVKPQSAATGETVSKASSGEAIVKKAPAFKDLKPQNPVFPYVMRMVVSYEAISGYPDKTFRGGKTITRAEFAKVMTQALAYLEKKFGTSLAAAPATAEVSFKDLKRDHWAYAPIIALVTKYKLLSGYPDQTFRPAKTISRFELATILAKAVRLVNPEAGTAEAVSLKDVKPAHWALQDVSLLVRLGIMEKFKDKKSNNWSFKGGQAATRFDVALSGAKLIELSEAKLANAGPVSASRIEQAVAITAKPQASISGGLGNVNESASGTNNWRGFSATAAYGDTFKLWSLAGNYELAGKYGFNQIVYLVPGSGGAVNGGPVNENRYELELNTIYPVVDRWGVSGKLLLGAKYISLSNPTAPTNFTGFNAGLVTSAKAFGRNLLLRGFWSLPLVRAQVSPSALGQPAQLFDYEASLDYELLSYPVLLGLSGEMMTFTGTGTRYYNMAFVRYFLF
ncbi:MAG: S-layer homology domain-containing protein [Candidatus Margulisiibacteriota bacterium]